MQASFPFNHDLCSAMGKTLPQVHHVIMAHCSLFYALSFFNAKSSFRLAFVLVAIVAWAGSCCLCTGKMKIEERQLEPMTWAV
jgi:hypothetical protein